MNVSEAIHARISTRDYIPGRKISKNDIEMILDAGSRAPSGNGLELWKFAVTDDMENLAKVSPQDHIRNASLGIIIFYPTKEYLQNSDFVKDKVIKNELTQLGDVTGASLDPGIMREIIEKGEKFQKAVASHEKLEEVCISQIAYPADHMMLQAIDLGISSVPMGYFFEDKIMDLVGKVDALKGFKPGLLIIFGYARKQDLPRYHRSKEELIIDLTKKA
jgi:nitroreductase